MININIEIERENFKNSIKEEIENFIKLKVKKNPISLIDINIEKDENIVYDEFDWLICISGDVVTLNGAAVDYVSTGTHQFIKTKNSFNKEEVYDIVESILEDILPNLSVARNTYSQILDIDIDEENISKYLEDTCDEDFMAISGYDWNFYVNFGELLTRSPIKSTTNMDAIAFVDIDGNNAYYLPVHNKKKMQKLPMLVRKFLAVHLNERQKEINSLTEKINFYRDSI